MYMYVYSSIHVCIQFHCTQYMYMYTCVCVCVNMAFAPCIHQVCWNNAVNHGGCCWGRTEKLNYGQLTHAIVELIAVFINSSGANCNFFNTRFQSPEHCPAWATVGDMSYWSTGFMAWATVNAYHTWCGHIHHWWFLCDVNVYQLS